MGSFNYPELDRSDRASMDASHPFVDGINITFSDHYGNEPTGGKNYINLVVCLEEIIKGTKNAKFNVCFLTTKMLSETVRLGFDPVAFYFSGRCATNSVTQPV